MPKITLDLNGKSLSIETGTLAKQADGTAVVSLGGTIVLATVVASPEPREGMDFFPLFVDVEEKMYAVGKIPGGFFKREGRPTEKAVLSARMIDRPIRPLFDKGLRNEVQIVVTVLSADQQKSPDVLGMVGASAALGLSSIPFGGPIGAVRIGGGPDGFIVNPTRAELEKCSLDLVVAGTKQGLSMIELRANQESEEAIVEALEFAREPMYQVIDLQQQLVDQAGKPKTEWPAKEIPVELQSAVGQFASQVSETIQNPDKVARESATREMVKEIQEKLLESFPEHSTEIGEEIEQLVVDQLRQLILSGRRPDGRAPDEIRPISCQVGLLPQAHGSALFTRGQTQVLTVVTLGGIRDEQTIDDLSLDESKRYLHQYNFPPYSVGEVRPIRGPGRRDIGHGALAERALVPMIPSEGEFPYAIRVVSEVLESNASSSMASVCASSLALMDAGVPIKSGAAGVSMGMVSQGDRRVLLTDIQGVEDFYGDMDFKVAGTENGVTGIQMDVKTLDLSLDTLRDTLQQAKGARLQVLEKMRTCLAAPRDSLSPLAPQIYTIEIHPNKIGDVIGPGGKTIKKIQADFEVEVDIQPDGRVYIAAKNAESGGEALKMIQGITKEFEVGEICTGKVVSIVAFGAFVELAPGTDGLLHISELARERVDKVENAVKMGEEVQVKIIDIDQDTGKIRLSRKALLPDATESESRGGPRPPREPRGRPRRR